MDMAIHLDAEEIARICARRGVARLRVFGSVLTERFDPEESDVDFIVDFLSDRADPFDDCFGLLEDLTELLDRKVDLVVGRSLRNPYFRESALRGVRDVFTQFRQLLSTD